MKKSANEKYMTPKGRASFMHVLKATENLQGVMEYSLDLMIPKTDAKKLAGMKAKYQKMCKEVWGSSSLLKRPFSYKDQGARDCKPIWKDGDARYAEADSDKKETYEAYRGMVYTKLYIREDKGKPLVIDKDGEEIISGQDIQSGDYVRCHIGMSAYTSKGYGKQFSLKLRGVQKLHDGDPLGGDSISKEDVQAAFMDADEKDFEYGDEGVGIEDDYGDVCEPDDDGFEI